MPSWVCFCVGAGLGWAGYISIPAVTAAIGSALTAGHFWKRAPKVTKRALAPTLGTSPRLGVPVIRHEFGGPPPRAIHGAGRLNRHPCRFTPQIHAEFRPACLTGRLRSKSKAKRGGLVADLIGEVCAFPCGSWLACDGINWVCLMYRGVCIAGKPAPTVAGSHS